MRIYMSYEIFQLMNLIRNQGAGSFPPCPCSLKWIMYLAGVLGMAGMSIRIIQRRVGEFMEHRKGGAEVDWYNAGSIIYMPFGYCPIAVSLGLSWLHSLSLTREEYDTDAWRSPRSQALIHFTDGNSVFMLVGSLMREAALQKSWWMWRKC